MDEREFNRQADAMLARVEAALDACAAELDFEIKPGGVIEIEFDDGSKIIVNRHTAAREIWLAARSGGYHFKLDGERWVGTRDGADLMAVLSRCATEQAGAPISLR
ncbi:MAG: iron donor protein CyaY [Rhodocyclaceae bacterium]|nr:iron donor protein CyaY [Rhodocyclaceae bacterium]